MDSDERQIRELHANWIGAVNAGDLAHLLTLVTPDVVLLSPGQAPADLAGFSANFRAAHRQVQVTCISDLEEVVVAGEVAYTRSRDTLSVMYRAGGTRMELAGYRITIYRRQPGGGWLLARDAHTLSPAAS
jgi:uncharacterized protein (TIGR02246 family)